LRLRSRRAHDRIAACRGICCGLFAAKAQNGEVSDFKGQIRMSSEIDSGSSQSDSAQRRKTVSG
jgi:hypothetical protein